LKGGDPALFGRSGEEAQALRQAGVQVEVVHGITAALSAADALGAPLTHREHAQGVMFVTGHVKAGGQPQDWEAIGRAARSGMTLVVYMGLAQVARLQTALLGQLSPATPAAIVQNASTPAERHVVCTLANLADTARREGFASPSVLIVGDVLRAGLLAAPQLVDQPQRRSAV
jgi:uroporphyrin-III C-methyltransferase